MVNVSGSQSKEINTEIRVRTYTQQVRPSDEGPTGWGVNLRNPESEQLEPFFSAASHTSRKTIPLLTPTAVNDLDMVRGISLLLKG